MGKPQLDLAAEKKIVDAITALDCNVDIVAEPLRIIQAHAGVDEEEAIRLFVRLQQRNLIFCKPERMANNMAETGIRAPVMRGKWVKAEERWK